MAKSICNILPCIFPHFTLAWFPIGSLDLLHGLRFTGVITLASISCRSNGKRCWQMLINWFHVSISFSRWMSVVGRRPPLLTFTGRRFARRVASVLWNHPSRPSISSISSLIKNENWYNGSFILFLYRGIRCAVSLMREILSKRKKATILFATETGRSEGFARNLAKLLSYTFDVKVC